MASNHVVILVLTGLRDEALRIGRALVAERLVASANIAPGITSIYRWDETIQENPEVMMILKSRADLAADVVARVRALHSYACPCVISLPILEGNPAYLAWIDGQTRPPDPDGG